MTIFTQNKNSINVKPVGFLLILFCYINIIKYNKFFIIDFVYSVLTKLFFCKFQLKKNLYETFYNYIISIFTSLRIFLSDKTILILLKAVGMT